VVKGFDKPSLSLRKSSDLRPLPLLLLLLLRSPHRQVKSIPVRKDDEVSVVRGTFKVGWEGSLSAPLLPTTSGSTLTR